MKPENKPTNPQNLPQDTEQTDAKREGWNADQLGDESSNQEKTEMARQIRRGDEAQGDPDERDFAGDTNSNETAHGRDQKKQELKNNTSAEKRKP